VKAAILRSADSVPVYGDFDEPVPLILGVTGIAGFLAVQNAGLLGAARVVGSGRSQPGLDRAARAGAQTVAIAGDRDADADALARVLDGDPPGLVLDFKLISDGAIQVPFRTFPLSDAGTAWTVSAESGPRVVLVPD
jgi:threonine dehydrogenase-like Zn-dependent dehydrogenase